MDKANTEINERGIFSLYVETINLLRRPAGKIVGSQGIGGRNAMIKEATMISAKIIYPTKHFRDNLFLSFTLTYLRNGFRLGISNFDIILLLTVIYFAFGLFGL